MDDSSKSCGSETGAKAGCSAVQMLQADQKALCDLFTAYGKTEDFKKKEELVGAISVALTQYASLENEVVYPALKVKEESKGSCAEPGAGAESYHQARLIIDQLQRLTADVDAAAYDKHVEELRVVVQKHFDEEARTVFPAIEKCSDKAAELNEKLEQFKAERNSPKLLISK